MPQADGDDVQEGGGHGLGGRTHEVAARRMGTDEHGGDKDEERGTLLPPVVPRRPKYPRIDYTAPT